MEKMKELFQINKTILMRKFVSQETDLNMSHN